MAVFITRVTEPPFLAGHLETAENGGGQQLELCCCNASAPFVELRPESCFGEQPFLR